MNNSDNQDTKYLATTALEDFWNVEMPILFLGDWCKIASRKSFLEQLNYTDVRSSWDKKEQVYLAREYTEDIFNNAINYLSKRLNYIHNENYATMYWEIVLGAWLRWYINVVYTRYVNLRDVIDNNEYFTTTLLSKEEYITPTDTFNFRNLCLTDDYNLQIYSRIFEALGMKYPTKPLKSENIRINKSDGKMHSGSYILLKKAFTELLHKFQNYGSIFLVNSSFDNLETLKLLFHTAGKVQPIMKIMHPVLRVEICKEKRAHLRATEYERKEFEMVLNKLLPFDVPICFIEGYEQVKQYVKRNYPAKPSVIFSSSSWYFREEIKIWAAKSKESGTTLIGTQHGGNYGSIDYPHELALETGITDRYYTWGWEKKNCRALVVPFYATKLSGRRILGADNSKQGILFVSTDTFRYPLYIFRHSFLRENYFCWQEIFISKIDINIRPFFRIRLHKDDRDNEMHIRWSSFAPDLHLEKRGKSFVSSLKECRLFISDHLSTTFVESLSANKPSILFWHPERNDLNDDAIPYYEMLKSVGILYHTPEEAAEKVNSIYHDVEGWWNGSELQFAVKKFCNRYAKTSDNCINEWRTELTKIISKKFLKLHPNPVLPL